MWPAHPDLATFTEEILNGKPIFLRSASSENKYHTLTIRLTLLNRNHMELYWQGNQEKEE